MRRGRWWVGVVATAVVALSGTMAQAAPVGRATSVNAVRSASAAAVADVPGAMHVLPVRRVLDTRSGLGAPTGLRVGGTTTTVTVAGQGGVPASGVGAVVVHVTAAVPPAPGSYQVAPGLIDCVATRCVVVAGDKAWRTT